MNALEKRIIDISYKYHLSHISSCLQCVNMIDRIFMSRPADEPFILSNGHAGLALYVVLEKYGFGDAEVLYLAHGTHPNRSIDSGIWCSSGSLGHGIGIAVGMALANRKRTVYVMLSDGECAEGSVWESLRVAGEQKLENLRVIVIANGFGAYGKIDVETLDTRLQMFFPSLVVRVNMFSYPDFLNGQEGHYVSLDKKMYETLTA